MFEKFFDSSTRGLVRVRSLRNGPGGSLLDSFSQELFHARYANITARRHIRAAEHFVDLVIGKNISMAEWNEHLLEHFSRHLSRRRCSYGHNAPLKQIAGARLFLRHLRDVGVIVTPVADPVGKPPLLAGFRLWMRQRRGTCDATLNNYDISICEFLECLGEDPKNFTAHDLRQFFMDYSGQSGHARIKHCATALRMFMRFLIAEGKCKAGLETAIPLLPYWRLATLPRYFQPEEIERIVASCDLTTPVGRRDRAILLLLARLGLRAGDIVHLRLGDIDWKEAWVRVCGKGRNQTRLPLTQEVGDAVITYLKESRPPTDVDFLFVCCRAPFRPFRSHCAISAIVDRAICRAGIIRPSRGAAHLLRHSAATSLLRQGASLQDIATILRHRSIQTTQIYAKVDVTSLHQIAQPWPEVQS
jgi:integrase/recombinase XerD